MKCLAKYPVDCFANGTALSEAVRALRLSLRQPLTAMLDEFEPTALYHMARLKAVQGRNDLARKYYERLKGTAGQEANIQDLEQTLGF